MSDVAHCCYRTESGLSCFVGCHIRDEFYNKTLENHACDSDDVKFALAQSGVGTGMFVLQFIRQLQLIHDTFGVREWEDLLSLKASECNLSMPKPTAELPLL